MGCSGSKTGVEDTPTLDAEAPSTSDNKYPLSETFIVPLDNADPEADTATTAKLATPNKLPPKRLQKLMEQAATTEATFNLEQLEDKQNKAELRRKVFLQQKLESIQKNTPQLATRSNKEDTGGQKEEEGEEEDKEIAAEEKEKDETEDRTAMDTKMHEIKSKALDDDSKRELLISTLNK